MFAFGFLLFYVTQSIALWKIMNATVHGKDMLRIWNNQDPIPPNLQHKVYVRPSKEKVVKHLFFFISFLLTQAVGIGAYIGMSVAIANRVNSEIDASPTTISFQLYDAAIASYWIYFANLVGVVIVALQMLCDTMKYRISMYFHDQIRKPALRLDIGVMRFHNTIANSIRVKQDIQEITEYSSWIVIFTIIPTFLVCVCVLIKQLSGDATTDPFFQVTAYLAGGAWYVCFCRFLKVQLGCNNHYACFSYFCDSKI